MDGFMLTNQHEDADGAQQLVAPFYTALSRCEQLWGDHAFQRWDQNVWRNQALAGMYDAQMLAVVVFSDDDFDSLLDRSDLVLAVTKNLFSDTGFEEAVRLGTNTPARLKERVGRIVAMLVDVVSSVTTM